MEAIKYEKESVLIKDGSIKAWVDIWVEDQDIKCDWNKNLFILTNRLHTVVSSGRFYDFRAVRKSTDGVDSIRRTRYFDGYLEFNGIKK